jgi:hypothetical protein
MPKHPALVLGSAVALAALLLPGCGKHTPEDTAGPAAAPAPTEATVPLPQSTPPPAPLPAPQELTDVLGRLADPAVSGADKVGLVEAPVDGDAATLDAFTKALRENHLAPLVFTATDLAWSVDTPCHVIADVKVTSPDPNTGFTFPMEFTSGPGGWQLSRDTADMLLAFGAPPQPSGPVSPAPPPPVPTPTP